jgi:hypothetical protein
LQSFSLICFFIQDTVILRTPLAAHGWDPAQVLEDEQGTNSFDEVSFEVKSWSRNAACKPSLRREHQLVAAR